MATQTVDSHQTSTSDEQTVKLSNEAVKVTEQINVSSPQETIENDRQKGKSDTLHILDSTLSTSEEKEIHIQVEPHVIEVKKTDEAPVVDLPVHDNERLEKESTLVTEVVTVVADETVHEESPSTEPVGEEATELPVIAFLERTIKDLDATDNVKSPPEEQSIAQVIEKEALEVPPAAFAQKVEEQPLEAVGLPKSEDDSSGDTVDSQEKEKHGADVQFVTEVAAKVEIVSIPVEEVEEKRPIKEFDATDNVKSPPEEQPTEEAIEREALEIVSVPVEEVEEKKPKIIDNPELSVVADSGKGPTEAEEEPVTECASVEKEPDKQPETDVLEESDEPTKKEAQPIEVVQVEEPIKVVAKEIIETVEPPPDKEQPVEVHPIKELEEAIAKEISEPIEVPEEKKQASEVEPAQESREVIETKISESVEVPHESKLLVEVHPANELVVVEEETNESIEPLENEEQSDEVISQNKSVEVIEKVVSVSSEPPKKEEADEGFSVTESVEVKEKVTNDSTLGSEEAEKQEKVIEVKDGIEELPEITKPVQDTYVEAELVKDEKPCAPGDDIGAPTERKIQEEEGSDKQDLVDQVAESGPIEDSVKGLEKEQPATKVVTVEKEPKKELETTCVQEESVEPPKQEAHPIEAVTSKEPAEVVAKEVVEIIEHPTEKEQPVVTTKEMCEVVTKEVIETVEPPIEKEQPAVIAKEISEVVAEEVIERVEPPIEKEKPVVIAKEICEVVAEEVTAVEPSTEKDQSVVITKETSDMVAEEVTETVEPPTEKEQPVVTAKEISEVVGKEVTETVEPQAQKEQTVVIAKETSESIEPLKNTKQPDEVISHKESVEVIAPEVNASLNPSKNNEKADEGFPVAELSNKLEENRPAKEFVSVNNEPTKEPETSPVLDLSVEPPNKEEQTIEVLTVEEQAEVITREIINCTELPKKMEEINVHPVQETREVTAEKISETSKISQENELLTSASFDPPKNKEAHEGFSVTESEEMQGKETSDSTLGSEEVVKHEPGVIEVEESMIELPKLTKHVQDTYVEVENAQDGKALAYKDDINPPIQGGENQEEEAQYAAESDRQVSVIQVAKSDLIEDFDIGIEKEQPATEFVSAKEVSRKEPETTCVPELSVDSPKKEESTEVLPAVKVIEKEILEGIELPTEKEHPIGVHPLLASYEVVEKEVIEPTELPKEREQAAEIQPGQESKEVIAEKINESLEIPKEGGLRIDEVQPVKELAVVAEETSESIEPPKYQKQLNEVPFVKESEVIAKEISESFIPSNDMKQTDEGFPVAESEGVGEKETSGSKLGLEEVEKRELEVTEVRDGKEELPEITNLVCNDYVKVETEAIENGGTMKGEKSLALGDESTPPLEVEKIHKEEQCTVESYKQDSLDHEDKPSVELAAVDISPQVVKEDERKESSNIDGVEDKHEKIQLLTLPREEVALRDFETDVVVVEKSTDEQKAGEVGDLIAETKIEESIKDEKSEDVENNNAHVHETPKEPYESELEVKDKEAGIIEGEVPKVNDKKVPSKQSHKHSHNLLSKVKQSLVKAKKAIIGKSPSSKTLTSEAKDDIKVK